MGSSDWAGELCVTVCVTLCVYLWTGVVQSTKDEKNDFVSMQSHTVCTANVDISMWTKTERPALGGWQAGRWREFAAPWHKVFPRRQLHTVTRTDPVSGSMVLEFPHKTSGSQLKPLQICNYWNWTWNTEEWTCHESKAGEGKGGIDVGNKGKVWTLEVVCVKTCYNRGGVLLRVIAADK